MDVNDTASMSMTSRVIAMIVAIILVGVVLTPIVNSIANGGDSGGDGGSTEPQYNEGFVGAKLDYYTSSPTTKTVSVANDGTNITLSGDYAESYPVQDMVLMASDSQSLCVKDGVMFYNDGTTTVPTESATLTLDSSGLNGKSYQWVYFPTIDGAYGCYTNGYEYSISDAVSVASYNGISVILKNGTAVSSPFGVTATPIEQDDKVTGYDIKGIAHRNNTVIGEGTDGYWGFDILSDNRAVIRHYTGTSIVSVFEVPSSVTSNGETYTVVGITGEYNGGAKTIFDDASLVVDSESTILVLPDTLTFIGEYTFDECSFANTSFTIPDSVEYVGENAFNKSLGKAESLVLGESLKTIGGYAFAHGGFESVTFNDSLVTVQTYAFEECSFTKSEEYTITLPESAVNIYSYAFGNYVGPSAEYTDGDWGFYLKDGEAVICSYSGNGGFDYDTGTISDVIVPSSFTVNGVSYPVVQFGNRFGTVTGDIMHIVFPNTLREIASNAFYVDYGGIRDSLVIPDSVEVIGAYAFEYNSISSLILGDSVEFIGDHAFANMSSENGFESIQMSDTVSYIGEGAFYNSYFKGELILPSNLTYIGDEAFRFNNEMTGTLTIPDTVNYIGDSAFSDCSGLTGTLTIPDSVTYLGGGAFNGCSGITYLINGSSAIGYAFSGTGIDTVLNIGGTEITATSYGLNANTVYDSLTTAGIIQAIGDESSGGSSGGDSSGSDSKPVLDPVVVTIVGIIPIFVILGILVSLVLPMVTNRLE